MTRNENELIIIVDYYSDYTTNVSFKNWQNFDNNVEIF